MALGSTDAVPGKRTSTDKKQLNSKPEIALGRKNWLFAGSLRASQRAAVAVLLIESVKLHGQDPYAYLKDMMEKLPTWPYSRIAMPAATHWQQSGQTIG